VTANFIASATTGCLPDATIEFTNQSTSVEPIASYNWDINGIASGTNENLTYTFTQSGLYDIHLTVADVLGNSDTYSVIINIAETPVVTLTSTPTPLSCTNTSVILEASPTYPNTTNTWYDPNGNIISNNTGVFVSNVGVYTFEIIDNTSGCSSSSTIEVMAASGYPEAVIQNPSILSCSNPTVTLDGTGSSPSPDYTYEWKIGNTVISTDLIIDVSYTGLYTLEVTSVANPWCSSTAQVNVMNDGSGPALNLPTTPYNDTIYNCQEVLHYSEDLVDASCTSCTVEIRNAVDDLICSSLPCVAAGGAWPLPLKIIVTDNTTGCFTATLLETPQPGSSSLSYNMTDESCAGGDGTIDVVSFTGSAGPYTIDWFDLPGTNDPLDRTNLSAGIYTLLITNIVGCPVFSDSLGIDFEIGSGVVIADASATDSVFTIDCNSTSTDPMYTLDASNSTMGTDIIYQWFDVSNNLVGEGITLDVTVPITYTLVVTDTVTQCSNSTSVGLVINQNTAIPIADAGPGQVITCNNPTITIDGSGSSIGSNFEYTWTDGNGNVISTDITVDISQPGDYTLMVLDVTNGCYATSVVTVSLNVQVPNHSIYPVASCSSGEIMIDSNDICMDCTIEIYDSNGMLVCNNLPCSFIPVAGDYTVTVTDTNNGCINTSIVNFIIPIPMDIFGVVTHASCNGGMDGAIDVTITGGYPPYSLNWTNSETTEDLSGKLAGTYGVTATDDIGCHISAMFQINETSNLGLRSLVDTNRCSSS